ncbi:NAD-P-binding protein [Stereum hirsutum FP-91666 SS1]|uniref:NAD-P-binding protein n=1 Tax=Stereum hirsutum (strain FP-91666) TaxID=721885 RepID=UPI000444A4CD|nr:NAD-P-binding protein [Stereum hirsutum FP-91666 SS1]EIM82590.1 NAD-P-binding protein [Stereum hirsutum FP-91666 SS1]
MASTDIPATQRSYRATGKGEPRKAIQLVKDFPVTTALKEGEVLVKVQAAALNPLFYKLLDLLPNFVHKRPLTAEYDFAGVVANANGSTWSCGDQIFGWITPGQNSKTKEGALCEYIVVPAENITLRPSNITPTQASGISLTGMTAYQAIFQDGKLKAGQTLFVNGGSTSVGAFAIIFAKSRGIKVVASASGKNEAFVRRMGADEFIDYTKQPLATYLGENPPTTPYDVILEAVGMADNSLYTHCEKYLAPEGIYLSVKPQPNKWSDASKLGRLAFDVIVPGCYGGVNRKFAMVEVKHKKEDLDEMAAMLEKSGVKPPVDSVFAFEDVFDAYDRLMTGRATGKVVVKVDSSVE